MKLIVASNNSGKIKEVKSILGAQFEAVLSMAEVGIDLDIEETGATFTDNALLKAHTVFDIIQAKKEFSSCAVLSDDSGLEADALFGAPGVYSARFSGKGDNGNNELLLQKLAGKERSAQYRAVVVFLDGKREIIGEGICRGEILTEYRGDNGFGYDPLFYSHDLNKTFAEATDEEKNQVSHRRKALNIIMQQL